MKASFVGAVASVVIVIFAIWGMIELVQWFVFGGGA